MALGTDTHTASFEADSGAGNAAEGFLCTTRRTAVALTRALAARRTCTWLRGLHLPKRVRVITSSVCARHPGLAAAGAALRVKVAAMRLLCLRTRKPSAFDGLAVRLCVRTSALRRSARWRSYHPWM